MISEQCLPCMRFVGSIMCLIMLIIVRVVTSESMKPRPCFQALKHRFSHFCHLFACCHFYYRITKSPFTIHITCILPSLRRTSAPIQLTNVLGVLGTQESSCTVAEVLMNVRTKAAEIGLDEALAETLWTELIEWSIEREARHLG